MMLAMVGARVTSGIRRRERPQKTLDASLFPGVFVLLVLTRIFPRWWIPLAGAMVVLWLRMLWSFIRSKRGRVDTRTD